MEKQFPMLQAVQMRVFAEKQDWFIFFSRLFFCKYFCKIL